MKYRFVCLFLAFVCLPLAACAPIDPDAAVPSSSLLVENTLSPSPETPMDLVLPYFPDAGLNPYTCNNTENRVFFPLLWEGLFELDTSFRPVPVLCERYTVSDDSLQYTFYLQTGVFFSDGSELSAADVVYSIHAAQAEGSLYESRLSSITAVNALDNQTVSISLSTPNGNLPALLDVPIVKANGLESDQLAPGTGPYIWTERDDQIILTAKENGWRQQSLIKQEIYLVSLSSEDQLLPGFSAHEFNLLTTDFSDLSSQQLFRDCNIWEFPTSHLLYVGCNTTEGPLRNAALRRALFSGISQATIVATAFSRHGQATALPLSPSTSVYDAALSQSLMNPEKSMSELLEEAGYQDRNQDGVLEDENGALSLTLLVCSDNSLKITAAEQIAGSMQQDGIKITLQELPWEDYIAALRSKSFDLYLAEVSMTADFDLRPLLASDGALNYGGFSDEQANTLLTSYAAATGDARTLAASELCTYIANEAPIFPICFLSHAAVLHKNVITTLNPTYHNLFFRPSA